MVWCAKYCGLFVKRQAGRKKGRKKDKFFQPNGGKAHWKSMSEYVKRWMSRVIGCKIFSFRTLFSTIEMINWPEEQFPVVKIKANWNDKGFHCREKNGWEFHRWRIDTIFMTVRSYENIFVKRLSLGRKAEDKVPVGGTNCVEIMGF